MSGKPKILFVCDSPDHVERLLGQSSDKCEVILVQNPVRALARLTNERFDGIFVSGKHLQEAFEIGKLLQNEQILEGMPDGVVLLDS